MDKTGQIIFHKDFHFTINAIKEVNLSRFDEPSASYNFNSDLNLNSDSKVAKVDDEIVCEAELLASVVDKEG